MLLLLALTGCLSRFEPYEGAFDLPSAVAVLPADAGGPFTVPVGYVSDQYGGRIALLDLASGRFLTDDPAASFARAAPLATGADRVLGALAAWAPGPDRATVFAADRRFATLLEIPHVIGLSGRDPVRAPLTVSEPVFLDLDGSGDQARLLDVEVKLGATATEDWRIESSGDRWWVFGSRSGRLSEPAFTGVRYVADRRALAFTIDGQATEGDRFELTTDNGTLEHDVGGAPLQLAMSPDQRLLALTVHDADADAPALRLFAPDTAALLDVALAEGASPGRMAWSQDGATLWIADDALPVVWELRPDTGELVDHALPWPVVDVAVIDAEARLYLAPADGRSVWIYDIAEQALVDVNPQRAGVDGMAFPSPVRGVEAIPVAHDRVEVDDDGGALSGRSVAISLANGSVVFMEAETGCLLRDEIGPHTENLTSTGGVVDVRTNFGRVGNGPFLQQNATNSRHIIVAPCAGIAPSELWTVRFDATVQAWRVEGAISGEQAALAREDTRYVSDGGEVSFVIRTGAVPSEDGWIFEFLVVDGVLRGDGDNDESPGREVEIVLPADPVFFQAVRAGELTPFVLVAAEGADLAARVSPVDGIVDVSWW